MRNRTVLRPVPVLLALVATLSFALAAPELIFGADAHTTRPFTGVKVNGGTVLHAKERGVHVLTLSDDFKVPDAPAPHWRVIDSTGNAYLLNRLMIKGDKFNKMIKVPSYIRNIKKVQIWCAWAETVLGETEFSATVR